MWEIVGGLLAGLVMLYLVAIALLWRAYRHEPDVDLLRSGLRLLPDLVRLLKRLASDSELPRGVRIRLLLLVVYLVSPIDLVPDFIPVIGYADDAIIVAFALRSVVRHAGADALARDWPGSVEGLRIVQRLAGVRTR